MHLPYISYRRLEWVVPNPSHSCVVSTPRIRTLRVTASSPKEQRLSTVSAQPQSEPNTSTPRALRAAPVRSILEVGRVAWDACHDGSNPFVSYDFLSSLEESRSVDPQTGWLPQHLVLAADNSYIERSTEVNQSSETLAVVPMYLKSHSYGEYVFDSAWAQAHDRHFTYGQASATSYYPKLQSCVPFSPVSGPRLLIRPDNPQREVVYRALARTLGSVPAQLDVSGLHITFHGEEEGSVLEENGFLVRMGVQYHWHNDRETHGLMGMLSSLDRTGSRYQSFEEFLGCLQQRRRKSVRQERKKAASLGFRVRRLTGADVQSNSALWDAFYRFYINTIDRKWGMPYLTRDFFTLLSERMADRVLLIVAEESDTQIEASGLAAALTGRRRHGTRPVAAALNLLGRDAIYGRNWGCEAGDAYKGLHFELCFYQAIEHAIENGFARVEAGAQGEHKLSRGYVPRLTYSSHKLVNEEFADAVRSFLAAETSEVEAYAQAAGAEGSPYKSE